MRILRIRFANLNSLVGEWEIDLTDPAYATEGLFAITGPTGAGKSTLLDAICLALYGRTPRQANVSKSQNEVMSRQTGECFAEVEFETPQGRWRVHWSQHRSRRKADGALQQPRQEIVDAVSGRVLHTRIRAVEETIERLTGMDFDRFTRSMLLAQGQFAAFLQADADERAPILEQITGTAIYSEISILVHQKRGEQRQRLEQLRAAQAGLQLLEEAQEVQLRQQLAQLDTQVQQQRAALEQQQRLLDWRTRLEAESRRQGELVRQRAELDRERTVFAPQQAQLQRGLEAQRLRLDHEPLQQRRDDLQQARQRLQQLKEGLPALERASEHQAQTLARAGQTLGHAEARLSQEQPLIARLREQDGVIRAQWRRVQQLHQTLPAELLQAPTPDPARLEADIAATEQALRDAQAEGDRAQLDAGLDELHQRGSSLAALKHQVELLTQRTAAQHRLRQEVAELEQRQRQQQGEIQGGARQLETLQREQQDLLKIQQLAERIARLEQQRHQLVSGEPCPLCGATEHPWAEQAPAEAREEQARLRQLERELDECQRALQQRQQILAGLKASAEEKRLQLRESQRETEELQARMAEPLSILGWQQIPSMERLAEAHQETGRQWKALNERRKRLDQLEGQLRQLREQQRGQQQRLAYDAARVELEQQQAQRMALSPEADTAALERRLQQAVQEARTALEQARSQETATRQALEGQRQQIASAEQRQAELTTRVDQLESAFAQRLEASPFVDEADFLDARLPQAQLEALQHQAQSLDRRENELNGQLRHTRETLEALQQQALTSDSLEQLEAGRQRLWQQLNELLQQQGSLQQQLERNAQLKRTFGEQQRALEAQQRELARWEQLHELIGSADGKKFRNFAQGLTFELMVGQANRQLQKMSDRYLLIRDQQQPLELKVIDNYQAGEIRSTRNLSGGEGFLVSLALALGLSGMASRNVRVDSLFLDEGFGTLDEEALETALTTLAELQREGKLIGVISHVSALKERINTRIEVQPLSGGRSRILGPGCRQSG